MTKKAAHQQREMDDLAPNELGISMRHRPLDPSFIILS
jgi:hypothetical protein